MGERSEPRRAFDWEGAHARLARAIDSAGGRSAEETTRILEDRARAAAQPRREAGSPADTLGLLVFSAGSDRYAVDVGCVIDVLLFIKPTWVPATPAAFLGVINHRGRILPVLDLRGLLGPGGGDPLAWRHIVTIGVSAGSVGIAADSLAGTVQMDAHELAPPPVALRRAGAMIQGVTPDAIAILDAEALARDPRVVVNEEVT